MSIAQTPRFSVAGIRSHEEARVEPSYVNVGDIERWASAIGGTLLVVQGLRSRSLPGMALAVLGGGLIYRGVTGHCGAYQALKIDTAGKQRSDTDEHVHRGRLIKQVAVIERPARELYDYWRDVENAPRFMTDVQAVTKTGENRSHWVSGGPFGKTFEWDSEVFQDDPGRMFAWKTLPGADVPHAGMIKFEPNTGGRGTTVTVEINYEPPAGMLGVAVAKMIGQDPDAMTKENLRQFKQLMETGEIPTTSGQSSGRV